MLYVSFYLGILLGFFHYCGVSDPLGIIEMKKHPAGGPGAWGRGNLYSGFHDADGACGAVCGDGEDVYALSEACTGKHCGLTGVYGSTDAEYLTA